MDTDLLEFFHLDPSEIKKISPEQLKTLRQNYTTNLRGTGIYYTTDNLIFESEQTYENWRYYAGLEYIENEEVDFYLGPRGFIAIFSCGNKRIERILDILNETSNEEDEDEDA